MDRVEAQREAAPISARLLTTPSVGRGGAGAQHASATRRKPNARLTCNSERGARGRSRTDTLLRAVDFPITSAFAAHQALPLKVRGLEHAFTMALRL